MSNTFSAKSPLISTTVISTLLLLLSTSTPMSSQTVLDDLTVMEHTPTRQVVSYPQIRQADVMWSKRIWRIIDLREKINLPLYYPIDPIEDRKSLFDVIKTNLIEESTLTAYSAGPLGNDDEFTTPLSRSEIESILFTMDTTLTPDLEGNGYTEVIRPIELESSSIKQYKIKEDWYFDKQRSERYVRIIGIAPVVEIIGEDGEIRGRRDLFWLYFPECRYVFANYDVYNPHNSAERRSFDDVFWKRMFGSYIIKEGNVYDRNILEYTSGIDHLLEAERIEEELFKIEHDLWSY